GPGRHGGALIRHVRGRRPTGTDAGGEGHRREADRAGRGRDQPGGPAASGL
ncbi:MAG: hypothetical protein AVDCRST_MAG08-2135, partial [uncultured Acetobacteraceae bacterium]